MRFDKTKSAGFLANHMARLFANGLHQRIAPLGIAPAQFMALLELWGEKNGLTQRMLVERLDVEQATMANTLARMQRDGLIEKKPHPGDKRAQLICLTQKAIDLKFDAIAAAAAQNRLALSSLSDDEHQQFLQLMGTVIKSMQSG